VANPRANLLNAFVPFLHQEEIMPDKEVFEVPQQMRDMAEKNIEAARAAYGQFMDAVTQAMSAWTSSPGTAVTAAFKSVQERGVQIAKENAEAAFALAADLSKAKDLQEVLSLQRDFAKKQMESYAKQAQELGRLMAEATRTKPTG
jgi:hypothetical protein